MSAKVLIYKTSNGGVSCKVNLNNGLKGFGYCQGRGKQVRWNKGKDRQEYPINVSLSFLDEFLYTNGIDCETVEIDKNSIDVFYGYWVEDKHIIFTTLSEANIKKWWDYNAPDFWKYEVNKDQSCNSLGMKLVYFCNTLVEHGSGGEIYVDNNMTEEEAQIITKGHETTKIAKEIQYLLDSCKLSDEEVKSLTEKIKEYESQIQSIIDKYQDEILDSVKDIEDGSYRFDFGFLYIYTENQQYNDWKGLVKNRKNDLGHNQWLKVYMPYTSQSLTIKMREFEKVKEVVFRELGEKLYCTTILD